MIDEKIFFEKVKELENLVSKMSLDELKIFKRNMTSSIFKSNLPQYYKDILLKALSNKRG